MMTTRRIITLLITLAILMTLGSCGKQDAKAAQLANPMKEVTAEEMVQTVGIPLYAPGYAGVYLRTTREEIGGTVIEMNSYIVLNEDGTGYWIAQDVGMLTWDESRLQLTVGAVFDIARVQENGIEYLLVYEFQDENGAWMPTAFERIEELPAEAAGMLP